MRPLSVVVILSGGLDSTTLLYSELDRGSKVACAVSFNYGQRHKKELECARLTCLKLGIEHVVIDLSQSGLTEAIAVSGSSLVSDTEVPEGHYAADNMKATIVPNRNMMMIAIAGAIAVARKADAVVTGVHSGDHFIYPDCRPEFIDHTSAALVVGNEGFGLEWGVMAPFSNWTKEDIAYEALRLNVPLYDTWSCYKGGEKHCGKCGTCVERLEAIDGALKRWRSIYGDTMTPLDFTKYEDTEFWKTAIKEGTK